MDDRCCAKFTHNNNNNKLINNVTFISFTILIDLLPFNFSIFPSSVRRLLSWHFQTWKSSDNTYFTRLYQILLTVAFRWTTSSVNTYETTRWESLTSQDNFVAKSKFIDKILLFQCHSTSKTAERIKIKILAPLQLQPIRLLALGSHPSQQL